MGTLRGGSIAGGGTVDSLFTALSKAWYIPNGMARYYNTILTLTGLVFVFIGAEQNYGAVVIFGLILFGVAAYSAGQRNR